MRLSRLEWPAKDRYGNVRTLRGYVSSRAVEFHPRDVLAWGMADRKRTTVLARLRDDIVVRVSGSEVTDGPYDDQGRRLAAQLPSPARGAVRWITADDVTQQLPVDPDIVAQDANEIIKRAPWDTKRLIAFLRKHIAAQLEQHKDDPVMQDYFERLGVAVGERLGISTNPPAHLVSEAERIIRKLEAGR